jgi:hypothetical protein
MADCICDVPYLNRYLDPLEEFYSKGLKFFPDQFGRTSSSFRSLASPYCLSGDFAPSTKETQSMLMELGLEYLRFYTELWKKDEPRPGEYMKALNTRKEAIKKHFRVNDPGGKMMVAAVGEERAEISLIASF